MMKLWICKEYPGQVRARNAQSAERKLGKAYGAVVTGVRIFDERTEEEEADEYNDMLETKGRLDRHGLFVEDVNGDVRVKCDDMTQEYWCLDHNCRLDLCKDCH